MTTSLDAVIGGLGSKAVDTLKLTLGQSWESLSTDERSDASTLMFTLARVHLYELAGIKVDAYLPALEAAFLNWEVVGKQVLISGFKSAATTVFGLGGAFAGSALAAFIKSIK